MSAARLPRVPRAPRTPTPAQACAEEVLAVLPAAMDVLRAAVRRHVGEQLSVPQFRCLNYIAEAPGASVGAVAGFLGVTMPTASAMVERLVRAGAVQHEADPDDRRRSQLRLTPSGQAQLGRIRQGARHDLAETLSARSADELQALMAGLSVLRLLNATARATACSKPRP